MASNSTSKKRKRGDRKDAALLRKMDGMHIIVPYLFPTRCDNEAYVNEFFDVAPVEAYVAQKNKEIEGVEGEIPYTMFHIFVAAMVKTVTLRPKMNRYIVRGRTYQREHVSASFVVKKYFGDDSEEGLAFINEADTMNLVSLHEAIKKEVKATRSETKDASSDSMDLVASLPNFVTRFVVWACRKLDEHDMAPKDFIATDPYHAAILLSNMGSVKMNAGYHHLTNWGTNSLLCLIGKKQKRLVVEDDGQIVPKDTVEFGITIDERVADGFYYSKSIALLKHLLAHPELLEQPFDQEVEFSCRL